MEVIGDSNVQIFMDTLDKSNNLKQTDWRVAKYYDVEALERISRNHQDQTGDIQISVSREDAFEAARRLKDQNKDKDVLEVFVLVQKHKKKTCAVRQRCSYWCKSTRRRLVPYVNFISIIDIGGGISILQLQSKKSFGRNWI